MSKKFQNSRPKLPVWESLSTKGTDDETVDETGQGDTSESTADVEKQNKKQNKKHTMYTYKYYVKRTTLNG